MWNFQRLFRGFASLPNASRVLTTLLKETPLQNKKLPRLYWYVCGAYISLQYLIYRGTTNRTQLTIIEFRRSTITVDEYKNIIQSHQILSFSEEEINNTIPFSEELNSILSSNGYHEEVFRPGLVLDCLKILIKHVKREDY